MMEQDSGTKLKRRRYQFSILGPLFLGEFRFTAMLGKICPGSLRDQGYPESQPIYDFGCGSASASLLHRTA